jgi:predicted permease
VLPALAVARGRGVPDVASARGSVSANRRTQRTRAGLIVAQIAAAIVLLSGAALALRSLEHVQNEDAGFDRTGAMTFGFVMRDVRYPTADHLRTFSGRVWQSLESVPGIAAVGLTTALPLSDQNIENIFTVDGPPARPGDDAPLAGLRGVAGHYRVAIGARLLQGRDLLPTDGPASAPVVIASADFVARYVSAANPVGVRVKLGGADSDDPWRTIVGVIATIRHSALDKAPRPEVWLPFSQMSDDFLTTWGRGLYVAARTGRDPAATLPDLRTTMRALDTELPLVDTMTLEELARQSTSSRRLETSLLAGFAAIAVMLAAIGLFGLLAFFVAQHVREFGVRLALGATPRALLALVIRRGMTLLAAGLLIGLPGAFAMGRGMAHLLYGITPTDPVAIGAGTAILAVATAAACGLPAWRAMKTDPLVALRHE